MRRMICIAAALAAAFVSATAQTPCDSLSLTDLTFVRQGFVRNFYTSSKVISEIQLSGSRLFLPNSANLVTAGEAALSQKDGSLVFTAPRAGETLVRVGAFHPFYCYEASFAGIRKGAAVGVAFYRNDGSDAVKVYYRDGRVVASRDGKELAGYAVGKLSSVELRVQYTGQRFHVFLLADGDWTLLGSVKCPLCNVDEQVVRSFGAFADFAGAGSLSLCKARSLLTCGTGQADPQIVQQRDGTPYIKDGKMYVCMTTRGFEQIPDSYQGVYSLDVTSYELQLEGAMFFGENDGLIHCYHATKVVWDEQQGRFLVITTTHGGNHTLAWCSTSADILHGIHYLDCAQLDFPHNFDRTPYANTEDPDFFFDSERGKWMLAYCALLAPKGRYNTKLCESDSWNGPYTLVGEAPGDNHTGIRITTVGGHRYVLSGGTDVTFHIFDYPSMKELGTFAQQFPNGGFRGWPTIVPMRCGNYERYLWITFDRGAITGRYSYGTLYFYIGDKMLKVE